MAYAAAVADALRKILESVHAQRSEPVADKAFKRLGMVGRQ
jgi:hypothetical protein